MSTREVQHTNERLARVDARLAAIEWNLQRVLTAVNLQWEEPRASRDVPDDVVALVREGNKIAAIKRYRELTGVGLAEASNVIDGV